MDKSAIDLWANFLKHEKLSPNRVDNVMELVALCEGLVKFGTPKFRPYNERVKTRELICFVAMNMGMDLTKFRHNGKMAMGRGLLDIWVKEYADRFGSVYGTKADKEVKRRNIKTVLGKRPKD